MSDLKKTLRKALENVEPWHRIPTTVPGLFLVKTPSKGKEEDVLQQTMVEINPVDEQGKIIKRRGLFLNKVEHLELFKMVMEQKQTEKVLVILEDASAKARTDDSGKIVL